LISVLRPRQHSIGYMGDGFLQVKRHNQQYQSTEGTYSTQLWHVRWQPCNHYWFTLHQYQCLMKTVYKTRSASQQTLQCDWQKWYPCWCVYWWNVVQICHWELAAFLFQFLVHHNKFLQFWLAAKRIGPRLNEDTWHIYVATQSRPAHIMTAGSIQHEQTTDWKVLNKKKLNFS